MSPSEELGTLHNLINFAHIFTKKVPVFRPKFYKNEPIFRIGHTGGPIEVEDSVVYYFDYLSLSNFQ